jgi:hypothetical protein
LKKEAKNFCYGGRWLATGHYTRYVTAGVGRRVPTPAGPKVFCFFFSKKKRLLAFLYAACF